MTRTLLLLAVLLAALPGVFANCDPYITVSPSPASSGQTVTLYVWTLDFTSCTNDLTSVEYEIQYTISWGDGNIEHFTSYNREGETFTHQYYPEGTETQFTYTIYVDLRAIMSASRQDILDASESIPVAVCNGQCGGQGDTTPPPAPTGLAATSETSTSVRLTWNIVTDPESGVRNYRVYRDEVEIGSTTLLQYTDVGLSPNTAYTYTVSAVNNALLEGAKSDPATATTLQTSPPGSTDTEPTNMIAVDSKAHICGNNTVWDWNAMTADARAISQPNGLCAQHTLLNIPTLGMNFTCAVNDSGWWWFPSDQVSAIARLDENGDETAAWGHLRESGISNELLTWDGIGCVNGVAVQSVPKHSPPPTLREGQCPRNRCYFWDTVQNRGDCVSPGTLTENLYQCEMRGTDATWTSAAARVAKKLLERAGSSYILSCGPQSAPGPVGVNMEGLTLPYNVCELGKISGGTASEILIGIAFHPANDQETDVTQTEFIRELRRTHPDNEFARPYDLAEPYDTINIHDFVYYNRTEGIAYFTSRDSFTTASTAQQLWNLLLGLFRDNRPTTLISDTAEHIYIHRVGTPEQYAVEWVRDSEGKRKVIIFNDGSTEDYTTTTWRNIIQAR